MIVMDKIEGHSWDEFRQYATRKQLWNLCVTFRVEVVKSFFDFLEDNNVPARPLQRDWIDGNQRVFFNGDGTHGNLIMQGDKPMFIDPDGFYRAKWDRFILKVHEHNTEWFNHYLHEAHRSSRNDK